MKSPALCLSFDFEECDLPREAGVEFPLERGMAVSREGADAVLDVLKRAGVKATFFCTLNFAGNAPETMRRLIADGHEIAAHGVDHFKQSPDDPFRCREGLRKLYGVEAVGYRQPRMFPVDDAALAKAGYRYNSSLNPAFVPGRYCHWNVPRLPFAKDGLLQIPAAVTPWIRFPLFWLALHVLPEFAYRRLMLRTLRHDGRAVTYFHPWEFSESFAAKAGELGVPGIVRMHLGRPMVGRLSRFIEAMRRAGVNFATMSQTYLEDPHDHSRIA